MQTELTAKEKATLSHLLARAMPDIIAGKTIWEAMGAVVERDRWIVNTVLGNREIKGAVVSDLAGRVYDEIRAKP